MDILILIILINLNLITNILYAKVNILLERYLFNNLLCVDSKILYLFSLIKFL